MVGDSGARHTEIGVLPADWQVLPLKEVVDPERRITYGIVQPGDHVEGGVHPGAHGPEGRNDWPPVREAIILYKRAMDPVAAVRHRLGRALERSREDRHPLDPHRVDLAELFGTYRSKLFQRFRDLGVDLTARHALAKALAYHTSNKPLFGFAKRHRKRDPKIQRELNIALAHHAEEGNEKGVALSVWAGADPHVPACNLRWGCECEEDGDGDERPRGDTAIERACRRGNLQILERLGPDPAQDDFDKLYRKARSGRVVEFLARIEPPGDMSAVIQHHLWWSSLDWGFGRWESITTLERLFELGGRWKTATKDEIAGLRRSLLKTSEDTFVDLMKLLATDDYCSPEILKELARTPAMRRKMTEVGFIPSPEDDRRRHRRRSRPTRSREVLQKAGIEGPKRAEKKGESPARLSRSVWIGARHRKGREVRLDRKRLFERVWSEPVSAVAREWGLSDQGLRKACRRLKIPVPPRGYWAKKRAGKRVHRPRLPELPEGQAEEIVVWERERPSS